MNIISDLDKYYRYLLHSWVFTAETAGKRRFEQSAWNLNTKKEENGKMHYLLKHFEVGCL